jgi:hypothetical protein
LIEEYDDDPTYWIFVPPRRMLEPRLRSYALPPTRSVTIIRNTVVINRTIVVEHEHDRRRRIAVNAGISPAIVAAARHQPVHTFRVRPHVLAGTQGVAGAVTVRTQELSRGRPNQHTRALAPNIQATGGAVQPVATVSKPQPLRKNERGRLGSHPPHAAQGSVVVPSTAAPKPTTAAPTKPSAQPAPTPPQRTAPPPREKHNQRAPVTRPGEPPPQTKPARPMAPQTPPPQRVAPPAAAHPQPPAARPQRPTARPVPPPHPPRAAKPTPKAQLRAKPAAKPGAKPEEKRPVEAPK